MYHVTCEGKETLHCLTWELASEYARSLLIVGCKEVHMEVEDEESRLDSTRIGKPCLAKIGRM